MLSRSVFALFLGTVLTACAGQQPAAPALPLEGPTYSCPMARGGKIFRGNGEAPSHVDRYNRYAWDWAAYVGDTIVAARGGIVTSSVSHWVLGGPTRSWIPFGNEIKIRHDDGTVGVYLHLLRNDEAPRIGETILRGERIGYAGVTGWTEGPHLHFNVHRNGISTPARFGDFSGRGGVPRAGDRHAAPAAPSTSQAAIDRLKRADRILARIESLNIKALELRVLNEALDGLSYEGYALGKTLEDRREELLDYFRDSQAHWSGSESFEVEEVLEAQWTRALLASSKRADRKLMAAASRAGKRGASRDRAALRRAARGASGFAKGLVAHAEGRVGDLLLAWKPIAKDEAMFARTRDRVLEGLILQTATDARNGYERVRRQAQHAGTRGQATLDAERLRIMTEVRTLLVPLIEDYASHAVQAKRLLTQFNDLNRSRKTK